MKIADLRKKDAAALGKLLAEQEAELRTFRFGMSGGRAKNVRQARVHRKTIARIKTIAAENKENN